VPNRRFTHFLQCIYVKGSLNLSHDLAINSPAANVLAFQNPVNCVMANTRSAFELANSDLEDLLLDFVCGDYYCH
jgi:hypothetical protein